MNKNALCHGIFPSVGRLFMHLAAALLTAVLFAHGALAEDGASPLINALAYDEGVGRLLKADATGLFSSPDDGRTWQPIGGALPAGGKLSTIAISAGNDAVIYGAGPGLGVIRLNGNSGEWTAIGTGLPSADVTTLTAHSTQPATLYAYVPDSGIYRTQDAGSTWKLMDRGPNGIGQLIHTNLAGSMETGWLYAATVEGVRFSMDCFCLWREGGRTAGAVSTIAVDPGQPDRLFAASADGIVQSTNGGQDWEKAPASPPQAISALVLSPSGGLFAGTVDGRVFRSDDQAKTWELTGD